MAEIEINAITDVDRRNRVKMLLPEQSAIRKLTKAIYDRAAELEKCGFKAADAVHVAAAERARADVLLSCDDRLCRLAKRRQHELNVEIVNPVDWLQEIDDVDA